MHALSGDFGGAAEGDPCAPAAILCFIATASWTRCMAVAAAEPVAGGQAGERAERAPRQLVRHDGRIGDRPMSPPCGTNCTSISRRSPEGSARLPRMSGDEENALSATEEQAARSDRPRQGGADGRRLGRTTAPERGVVASRAGRRCRRASKARSTCCCTGAHPEGRPRRGSRSWRSPSNISSSSRRRAALRLELAADYLVMAAWLAYPEIAPAAARARTGEEPQSGEELAAALAFRLQRLEAMRDAAARLVNRDRLGRDVFAARRAGAGRRRPDAASITATLYDLLTAYAAQRQRQAISMSSIARRARSGRWPRRARS